MAIMESSKSFRSNAFVDSMIRDLFQLHPDRYDSEAHVVRCAIIKLHEKEVGNHDERKR